MPIQIIRRRGRVTTPHWEWFFASKSTPGAGRFVECSPSGVITTDKGKKLYAEFLAESSSANGDLHAPVIKHYETNHIECALGQCVCGNEVALHDPLDNECDRCHRWYNMSGQEVTNPNSAWGKAMREEDDRYADPEDR